MHDRVALQNMELMLTSLWKMQNVTNPIPHSVKTKQTCEAICCVRGIWTFSATIITHSKSLEGSRISFPSSCSFHQSPEISGILSLNWSLASKGPTVSLRSDTPSAQLTLPLLSPTTLLCSWARSTRPLPGSGFSLPQPGARLPALPSIATADELTSSDASWHCFLLLIIDCRTPRTDVTAGMHYHIRNFIVMCYRVLGT